MFKKYRYRNEFVERMMRYYSYLNKGLTIRYNGKRFRSKDGLKDLLEEKLAEEPLYPFIHLEGMILKSHLPISNSTERTIFLLSMAAHDAGRDSPGCFSGRIG